MDAVDKGRESQGIAKAPTGITGFDAITYGGLPRGRTTLVMGAPGTGKTVFALQTLANGARQYGEPGIFVAFEENSSQLITNAATFGWDLQALQDERLVFIDARLSPDSVRMGGFDLSGMLSAIKARADEMGARRIVFDSVNVLLTLLDSPSSERQELYRLRDWLAENEYTGIITSGVVGRSPERTLHLGFMQFMGDCVVSLSQRTEDWVAQRGLQVLKYRGSAFAENEFPLVIDRNGIEVAPPTEPWADFPASTERISSGVERFDGMLSGGYLRGSSVLVTGAPGTAKSTLAGAFTEATCLRGERALYVSFDESGAEIIRNLRSVSIDLKPYMDSGLLRMYSGRAESRSPEQHLVVLKRLIEEHRPRCMVVDPLSAMVKTGADAMTLRVARRLLAWVKAEGITLVITSLLDSGQGDVESTEIQVSTIADTWVHVSYMVQAGERNRTLTIVKSRGTKHSNQVRELVLSDEGVTLADVYTAGGEVLTGTLRWVREAANRAEATRRRLERERSQREFELAEAGIRARIQALETELELRRVQLEAEAVASRAGDSQAEADQLEVARLRSADDGTEEDTGG